MGKLEEASLLSHGSHSEPVKFTILFFPKRITALLEYIVGRCGGLVVRVLDSGSSGPGSGPDWGHCVVFLGKTLYSHGASLHSGV